MTLTHKADGRPSVGVLALLLLPAVAPAQAERYELGERLKAFEAAWDAHPDAAARKRALKGLPDVTQQFFTFRFGEAGRTLDDARFALASDQPPSDALRWATSLYPDVPRRLIGGGEDLTVNLKAFYTVKGKPPAELSVRLTLDGGGKPAKPVTVTPDKFPAEIKLLPPSRGDLKLSVQVLLADKPVVNRTVGVSVIDDATKQADQLLTDVKALKATPSLETASIKERARLLKDLAKGDIPETDAPAAKRLAEAQEMLTLAKDGKPYFTADRPGDHWLTVPTGDKDATPCRLFVPKGLDAKKLVPLVVAMHGAGGSENLFFEGYGAGHVVKLCEKRGWLLVSPRAGLGFGLGGAPPVGEIIDKLAERYPIDPKAVFIVGHSMGAAMTVEAVQKYPGRFAAAAALAGGGRVRHPEAFAELPVFVGVGDKDFAVRTAKGLHKALTDAKAKNVTYKEYPDVEHLVIVREALGDVFEGFEKQWKR